MKNNGPKSILLVEDDQDILDILYYIFSDEGYRVERSLGDHVINEVGVFQPDLILLDHRLQVAWGADICRELKASPHTRHIPVIMMSAVRELEAIAQEAGADGHLPKPFDMEQLLGVVRWWLQATH
ncbi:response regulator transcription factor [Mucilaginibacter sp. HC2]|uniref:response regulator n=1 Tax=Mucilaginibacter inviolabilis TaxID=2714892 RepID=UPI001408913A|nr:response regulator [Mucilaginibacter inviolabilis]NHA02640.1 response regulator transcription factor [Mucilaginibacter inviolabilis]